MFATLKQLLSIRIIALNYHAVHLNHITNCMNKSWFDFRVGCWCNCRSLLCLFLFFVNPLRAIFAWARFSLLLDIWKGWKRSSRQEGPLNEISFKFAFIVFSNSRAVYGMQRRTNKSVRKAGCCMGLSGQNGRRLCLSPL